MNTTALKIAGFAGILTVAGAAAFGIGRIAGPIGNVDTPHDRHSAMEMTNDMDMQPGGLAATQNGYTLQLDQPIAAPQTAAPLRFRILDGSGTPVTRFDVEHDKELHLIVVRRDLTGYQHLHPERDASGTWSTDADLSQAGAYKVFTDFAPAGGAPTTLGADLAVGGDFQPQPLPAASTVAQVDGYTVTMSGAVAAQTGSMVTFTVSRDGRPVTDLQPYLAAYGHLVALRAADLAYLHVHPTGASGAGQAGGRSMSGQTAAGPDVTFHMTAPSAGAYRLFLDFKHGDRVHTAAFTVDVAQSAANPAPSPAPAMHAGH